MGEIYDKVKHFEYALNILAYKHFSKQVAIFEEMMELYLEPIPELNEKWHFDDGKNPTIILLSRMFNDFESAKLMLLNGLPEQANIPLRDALECMMLFRLFGVDSKLALRWMKNLKEYHPSNVKKRLDELKIDCPEYSFYGMLSHLTHANLLSVVSTVAETKLGDNLLLQTYNFGGMNNPTWIGLVFNTLFIFLYIALRSVLPPVYLPDIKQPEKWWDKVVGLVEKLEGIVEGIEFEELERSEKDKRAEEEVFRKLGFAKIKAALFDKDTINADKGFSI